MATKPSRVLQRAMVDEASAYAAFTEAMRAHAARGLLSTAQVVTIALKRWMDAGDVVDAITGCGRPNRPELAKTGKLSHARSL